MGLSQDTQDAVLNWLRGNPMPSPASLYYLGLHRSATPSATDEVSSLLGGRIAVRDVDWGVPSDGPSGIREITNNVALTSRPCSQAVQVMGFGLWDANTGGNLVLTGVVEPVLDLQLGDPAVFLVQAVRLRATA